MEIRFKIQPDDDREWLVERLARMICGTDQEIIRKESGYEFQLDHSNDWWLSFVEPLEGKTLPEVRLAYRYGVGEHMTALKEVILWLVGNPHIQDKE